MPARKMRVELFDSEGNRYTLSFEGQITRDKALRLLDLVELLGGVPGSSGGLGPNQSAMPEIEYSKFERLRLLVQKHFPLVWFSSREVETLFEQECKQPIGLSTVATYLARMAAKGFLVKTGTSKSLRYKTVPAYAQTTVRQQLPK